MGKIWLYGVGFAILFAYGSIWYLRGFGALQEDLSSHNYHNLIAVVITLAPAYFLQKLAGAIEEKHRGKALRSLTGIFLSVAAFVLMGTLVTVKNDEDKNTVGNDQTREYQAASIRVKGKSATMYQHKNYFLTLVSGPVGSEGIPETIQIGDVVTVKDNTIQVQYIFVTEVLADMKYGKEMLARKGDVHCTIVQSRENLPYVDEHKSRDRLWVNVKDCEPLMKKDQ